MAFSVRLAFLVEVCLSLTVLVWFGMFTAPLQGFPSALWMSWWQL
jgi:hypothetical protein